METKAFWKSKTLQGLVPILVGAFLPKYLPIVTETIPYLDAILVGAGSIWTAIGRFKAKTTLTTGSATPPTQ